MGGSSYSLLNLIHSLEGTVRPVIIVPQEGLACEEFKKRGIKYYVVPFHINVTQETGIKRILTLPPRYVKDRIINFFAVRRIVQIARFEKAQLVHTNSAVIDFGQNIADALGIKHVWHLREFLNLDFGLNPAIGWNFFLKKIHQSSAIICISESVQKHYKLSNHPKSFVLYNAVRSVNQLRSCHVKKEFILYCGAVTREKGIEDAIKAISLVKQNHQHIKLLVLGRFSSAYYAQLKILMEDLQVANLIEFLGHKPNIDDYMAEALCLLMCSRNEAFGRVTIEAMFNNCPVIGYDQAGTSELIQDNKTGYLYLNVDELAEKINYIINHKSQVNNVVKNAQEYASKNFSEEQFAVKLLTIYNRLI